MRTPPPAPDRCICRIFADCPSCARHIEFADFAGQPLIMPELDYDASGAPFCADRIPAAQPGPAAVCEPNSAAVRAVPNKA